MAISGLEDLVEMLESIISAGVIGIETDSGVDVGPGPGLGHEVDPGMSSIFLRMFLHVLQHSECNEFDLQITFSGEETKAAIF